MTPSAFKEKRIMVLECPSCGGKVKRHSETSWDDVTGELRFECKTCGEIHWLHEVEKWVEEE
jgi:ribosomal protein L32